MTENITVGMNINKFEKFCQQIKIQAIDKYITIKCSEPLEDNDSELRSIFRDIHNSLKYLTEENYEAVLEGIIRTYGSKFSWHIEESVDIEDIVSNIEITYLKSFYLINTLLDLPKEYINIEKKYYNSNRWND